LNRIFKALSDPTRRQILDSVARKDVNASELAAPFRMSAPAISKHLKVLETAGLIDRTREGRIHRFRLQRDSLEAAERSIARLTGFWNQRLENLDKYIESKNKEDL
jgi:DNA-binding transcriptional ArsR family regulator